MRAYFAMAAASSWAKLEKPLISTLKMMREWRMTSKKEIFHKEAPADNDSIYN